MPDPEPTPTLAKSDARTESAVMTLLLSEDDQRPWSTDELIGEIGRDLDTTNAIASLRAAGLLHRTTDGFVFATRAATHLDRLDL